MESQTLPFLSKRVRQEVNPVNPLKCRSRVVSVTSGGSSGRKRQFDSAARELIHTF